MIELTLLPVMIMSGFFKCVAITFVQSQKVSHVANEETYKNMDLAAIAPGTY